MDKNDRDTSNNDKKDIFITDEVIREKEMKKDGGGNVLKKE